MIKAKVDATVWVLMWAFYDYADDVNIIIFNSYKSAINALNNLDSTDVVWSDIVKKQIND